MRHIAVVRALVGVVAAVLASSLVAVPAVASSPDPSMGTGSWPGGAVVIVQLHGAGGAPVTSNDMIATIGVIQARLTALGMSDVHVDGIADDRLRIDIADPAARDVVARMATAPGNVEFVGVPEAFASAIEDGGPLPSGMVAQPLFGSEGVAAARLGTTASGLIAVDIDLQPAAAQAFDAYAADNQGQRFAIVLDGVVIEAPTINARNFNGHAQISSGFDDQGARELIAMLTAGVLPLAAELVQECPASGSCPGPSASPSVAPGG